MRDLLAVWRSARALLDEAQEVHDRLSQDREPAAIEVLAPLAYRHLVADRERGEQDVLIGVAGHYLSQRYPTLREYFLTKPQQERLRDLRAQIDDCLNGEGGR